jgi:hypothetical protein
MLPIYGDSCCVAQINVFDGLIIPFMFPQNVALHTPAMHMFVACTVVM